MALCDRCDYYRPLAHECGSTGLQLGTIAIERCAVFVPSTAGVTGVLRGVPEGRKDDDGKLRYDLLPVKPLRAIVEVLTYGAKKYAPNNWQKVERPRERYSAAAMRHLEAWRGGEKLDPESGLPHLAHAGCCILFLLAVDD